MEYRTVVMMRGLCGVEADSRSQGLVLAHPLLAVWLWECYFILRALVFLPVKWEHCKHQMPGVVMRITHTDPHGDDSVSQRSFPLMSISWGCEYLETSWPRPFWG